MGRPKQPALDDDASTLASVSTPGDASLEALVHAFTQEGPNEDAFYERRRRLGLGVGLDGEGNIIHASDLIE